MLTARLGSIIAVVAASAEHHGPAADSGIRGAGPRRNYTNPAEPALFPGNLDQLTYGIRPALLGAGPSRRRLPMLHHARWRKTMTDERHRNYP